MEIIGIDKVVSEIEKPKKVKKLSPYTILYKWLQDGSNTPIPQEIVENTSIGAQMLIYYFQSSHYCVYMSNTFNNINIFSLDRLEAFKFLKSTIQKTKFKPKYISKSSSSLGKLEKAIKKKYIFLNNDELKLAAEFIDDSDEKDLIYDMLGLKRPSKRKTTKKKLKEIQSALDDQELELDLDLSLDSDGDVWSLERLMTNFTLVK